MRPQLYSTAKSHTVFANILLAVLVSVTSATAFGQTPTPSPTPDPLADLKKLKEELELLKQIVGLQKDISVAEADRATAEKNKILNMLPSPTATPLAGSATITNFTFENEILAYRAVGLGSGKLAEKINVNNKPPLIIYNDNDIKAMEVYGAVLSQIRSYNEGYSVMPGHQESAATLLLGPQIATTFLRSVVDLVSLFRTDVKIEGLTFSLNDDAVAARVADRLSGKFVIYNPSLLLPNAFGDEQKSAILSGLYALQVNRVLAEKVIADATIAEPEMKRQLASLNTVVDRFLAALQTEDSTKPNALARLYRAEKVLSLFPSKEAPTQAPPYILYLKLVKAGGSHTTKTNLWKGSKVTETGGAAFGFALFDSKGALTTSGICYAYMASSTSSPAPVELLADCDN